jgi:rubrerythrin
MSRPDDTPAESLTRGRLLWGGAAAAAGAAAIGARTRGTPLAAGAKTADKAILNVFLTLERVQKSFYDQAAESGRLDGELLELAGAVAAQEGEHVTLLADRLGEHADPAPRSNFGDAFASRESFLKAAVDLEEAVIGVYVGQAANLSRDAVKAVVPLVSVEARQVAWLRDLQGVSPAPRAADPARPAGAVLRDLRQKGYLA